MRIAVERVLGEIRFYLCRKGLTAIARNLLLGLTLVLAVSGVSKPHDAVEKLCVGGRDRVVSFPRLRLDSVSARPQAVTAEGCGALFARKRTILFSTYINRF